MTPLKVSCLLLFALPLAGCHLPGKPSADDIVPRPTAVTSFPVLYGQNCAGCHGANGQEGAATNLANPEYEALIDDANLREIITKGEPGSLMPAFGISSGGTLTSQQVDALIHGMRAKWGSQGNVLAGQNGPSYKGTLTATPANGAQIYTAGCARCHGAPGAKPGPAGNILDGSLLALVNAQMLRTTIIAGRPDLGQWMLAQRPSDPGQPYASRNPMSPPSGGKAQPQAPFGPPPGQSRIP
jgi:cytochrome c oxidase cbb3-type subunit 3